MSEETEMMSEEEHNIVIVGGGICGLATALALHRKGIDALVLEKSDSLRAAGAAIGVFMNGWRALDQLGVSMELRKKAIPITEIQDAMLNKSGIRVISCRNEEVHCLKRSDLIAALANELPVHSVRFGCKIVAIESDPVTSFPIIHVDDGSKIKAKVLVGCDGSNSVVGKSLGLEAPELFPMLAVRGITEYPNGHSYASCFFRLRGNQMMYGRIPVDEKLVYWFVGWRSRSQAPNPELEKIPHRIRNLTLELLEEFPQDVTEMVQHCDLDLLSFTHIRYRSPWRLLTENLWSGTTTVAGDAMHAMGPFLGQGGSAAMEDAVVLARCLARELGLAATNRNASTSDRELKERAGTALSRYAKERRMRLVKLALQAFLMGSMFFTSSWAKKVVCLALLLVFFDGMSLAHTSYDCGVL